MTGSGQDRRNAPLGEHLFAAACFAVFGGAFWFAFYHRYWAWRDCIAEAYSSCITPDGDSLIEGGAFWSVPAVLFTFAALRRVVRVLRAR